MKNKKMLSNEEIIKKAESYLAAGLYVVPGPQGKKFPYNGLIPSCKTVSYDVKDYPDRAELIELFKKYPGSNIIALVGNGFGLVAIDIDVDKHGKFSADAIAIIETLKDYPTYVKKTPSNGLQYLYKTDPKRPLVGRKSGYRKGVDILLDGASPMPPSKAFSSKINAIGEYTEDDPIELQPVTLFPYELFPDLIDTSENKEKLNTDKRERIQEQLDKGEITEYRNDTFHYLSVKVNATFPNEPKTAWNLIKSLYDSHANKKGFPVSELKQIFNSALKGKVVAAAKELNKRKGGIKEDLCFLDSTEILRLEVTQTKWTVPFVIPKAGIVALCADAGVGKTWLGLDMSVCIVTGRKFLGMYDVEQGPVMYINQEMTFGEIQRRLKELGLPEGAPFYTFKIRDFSLEEYGEQLIELAKEIKPVLIVFDSLSRIHSKNENSSQEMNWVTNFFIKVSDLGSAVLSPHHVTKSDNPDYRGSSAIKAAVDLMLFLDRVKDTESEYILKYEKVRVDTLLKPKKLRMVNKDGAIRFEYAGDLEKTEVEKPIAPGKNKTTKEAAQRLITSKLISDKLAGVNGTLKATVLGEATIQGLNARTVENELQALVRDKTVIKQRKGADWLYSIAKDEPEPTSN